MRVKVLFDKTARDKKLHTGWGISFLVRGRIIFDTGEKGSWLAENMKMLKVDPGKIEAAVISHDHWDHRGGLRELLKRRKGLPVYACPNFSREFKEKVKKLRGYLIEAKKKMMVAEDIFVTGEIAGEYDGKYMPEQAMVVRTKKGISVLTGCAHPGIIRILRRAKKIFPREKIHAVLGGFHLMDRDKEDIEKIAGQFRKLGVQKAGAAHCSGAAAEMIFKAFFKNDFIRVQAGTGIEV
jgi:7,8-dihydropterin-6-yl-methyl-4-(beta-D-ribofuranosyl)aminobenzene 5'-phosphate synthase